MLFTSCIAWLSTQHECPDLTCVVVRDHIQLRDSRGTPAQGMHAGLCGSGTGSAGVGLQRDSHTSMGCGTVREGDQAGAGPIFSPEQSSNAYMPICLTEHDPPKRWRM